MLRKIIKCICLSVFCLLSIVGLSACCAPGDMEVNIIFYEVDPDMGVSSYIEKIPFSEDLSIEFVVPEGYDHSSMTAKIDDRDYEFNVEFGDDEILTEYEYSTSKTITMTIKKVTRDFSLTFDMSNVRKKQFDVTVDENLLRISETEEDKVYLSNLKVVSINPESLKSLKRLDNTNILGETIISAQGTATIDYGEHIALVYSKGYNNGEIPVVYSEVGHFSPENKILDNGTVEYVEYNVASRGNTYYNVYNENNVASTNTRIFYLGKIQEPINLYRDIPNYEVEKGFVLENNENKFSILTNKQDHASEMLSINFFAPTSMNFSDNEFIDRVDGVVVEKIDKYTSGTDTLKNSDVLYEIYNRYDVYNMYVGENKDSDKLLTASEKQSLSDVLYLNIGTQDFLKDHLNIHFITYEKQPGYDTKAYKMKLTDYIESSKGERFYKIDKNVISEFLMNRGYINGDSVIPYKTGNAIMRVEIDPAYIDETRLNKSFPYSSINYPTTYGGKGGIDYDYKIEFYVLNEDGSKDYGFLDMHQFSEDIVYFETDKLWKKENGEWVCLQNLYVTITGPKYNDYYSPVIERVYMELNYDGHIATNGIPVEDATVFNGIQDYQVDISGLYDVPNPIHQYKLETSLILTRINNDVIKLDCHQMAFDGYNDMIYATNNINFDDYTDFIRLNNISVTGDINLNFGSTLDIYYFVASDSGMDFDVYVGQVEEGTNNYVGIKDEKRKISATKKLYDIVGNEVKISLGGKMYSVYVKYQDCDVYDLQGKVHFAFT